MLTRNEEVAVVAPSGSQAFAKMFRVEWIGQTMASVFWICSVFSYGVSSSGDWLQLGAASAWLVANIATVATDKAS